MYTVYIPKENRREETPKFKQIVLFFFYLSPWLRPSQSVANNNIQLRSALNNLFPLLCQHIVSNHLTSCN